MPGARHLIALLAVVTLIGLGQLVQAQTTPRLYLPALAQPPASATPSLTSTTTPQATATATSTATPSPTSTPPVEDCDPSYPTVCIPPPPPDLNCSDISFRRFTVLPPDPHNFDTDGDGIGCESG